MHFLHKRASLQGSCISRKEIRNLTKLGNKVISKFLLLLERFELISCDKIGKIYYYKMNLANPFSSSILNIIRIEKEKLNNLDFEIANISREFVYELTNVNIKNLKRVILFGSYAKRTYTQNSDIDIAIILKEKNPSDELLITESIDRIKKRFKKDIQAHYFTEKEFEKKRKASSGNSARWNYFVIKESEFILSYSKIILLTGSVLSL